jgi:hypothetical protein
MTKLIIFLIALMVVIKINEEFLLKQWKQITATTKVYNVSTLITPLDSLGTTDSLTYMIYKITEYGDTLQKRKITISAE